LRLFWDQRRFLLRIAAYGLVASTLIAFLIPKRYQSTARLMPPDTQSSSGLAMMAALSARTGGLGTFASDLLGLRSSSALFVGILRSRTVEDRLIEKFHLRKVYWARRIEDARKELESNTDISEDRKSGIVTVTVTEKNPQRAAAMAQAYVNELDRLVAEVTTSSARRERIFLEERLKSVKQELDQAAQEFSQFASKNTAIDIKEQGRAMVEAAATLQGQLIAAESELSGLQQIYTDNNVRVRALRARIGELKRQLEKLGGQEAGSSSASTENSLYPSIRKLPLLGVTYSDLFRRTKIAEVVYELLTQQYELAKVQEAKEIPTVKVLDAPVVPEKKSFPPRLILMCLGTMLSLAFGVTWVLGRARWNQIDPQDPARVLAGEVLGTLQAKRLWVSQNGNRLRGLSSRLRQRFNGSARDTQENK
jgi:capsule polysaccharide export protein KpsE/RkpR